MPLTSNNKYMIMAIFGATALFICLMVVIVRFGGSGGGQDDDLVAKPKLEYVYFAKDVKKGAVVKDDDVIVKESKIELDGAYKTKAEVVGQVLSKDVTAEKPVMKAFIKQKKVVATGEEPVNGFRAIPILIKKSSLPPYLETGQKFDLLTKEGDLKIENLKILNILEPTKNDANKMLLLEIRNSDVPSFIKHQIATSGFVFLQKNPKEYGEYKFIDKGQQSESKPIKYAPDSGYIPPVPDIPKFDSDIDLKEDKSTNQNNEIFDNRNKKEVEVIIGDQKTKVEFEE